MAESCLEVYARHILFLKLLSEPKDQFGLQSKHQFTAIRTLLLHIGECTPYVGMSGQRSFIKDSTLCWQSRHMLHPCNLLII